VCLQTDLNQIFTLYKFPFFIDTFFFMGTHEVIGLKLSYRDSSEIMYLWIDTIIKKYMNGYYMDSQYQFIAIIWIANINYKYYLEET